MATAKTAQLSPEAAFIRSKLRLRFNTEVGCYQVFTCLIGNKPLQFKWYNISEGTKQFYMQQFNLITEDYFLPDFASGALKQYNSVIAA